MFRFFVACTSCAPPMPVHSTLLSIHAMTGLPRLLFPGTRPVITALSILYDSCLIMCPKYPSFLAFTLCSNSGFSCNLSHTATLVSFAVHGTLRTLLAQLFSNALSFISSAFLRVQLSHPYVATGHTKAFTKRHFDFFVIPLFLAQVSAYISGYCQSFFNVTSTLSIRCNICSKIC